MKKFQQDCNLNRNSNRGTQHAPVPLRGKGLREGVKALILILTTPNLSTHQLINEGVIWFVAQQMVLHWQKPSSPS